MALTAGATAQEIERVAGEASREERNMAALAQGLGIVVALPIWLLWRRRSGFVRAHAAGSIAFDAVTLAAFGLITITIIGSLVGGRAVLDDMPFFFLAAVCAPGAALAGFLVVMLAALVLRIRATIAATQGRSFHYPLLRKS